MWQDIHGHDDVAEMFRRCLQRGRLASTFLFVGPPGVGKRTFARKLAQALLCETRPDQALDPCGSCPACVQVQAGSHPDLDEVSKPADKSFIPTELFIGDREHRMRSGLCHNISLKPYRGGRKIAIIDDADYLNQEGANCLLKTLEEPPPKSLIVLIGTSEQKQLPTIRSRCQIVRFRRLDDATVAALLRQHELVGDDQQADRLASLADGSLARALEMADPALEDFRRQLFEQLSQPNFAAWKFAPQVSSFVEEAGRDAPSRRVRLKQVLRAAADFYRQLMRAHSGLEPLGDELLRNHVQRALQSGASDAETAAVYIDRCVEAERQVEANANQSTLIECWLDDLAT